MEPEKDDFVFTGRMQGSPEVQVLHFDDEDKAKNFANENASDHPIFTVVDSSTGDVVYSNEMADEEEDAIRSSMFPDEGSEEGFDYTYGD